MAKIPAVTEYTISESLFGGYVANYQCPHCDAQLKSKEDEIGQADQCPKCGNRYGVTRKASREIQEAKDAKVEEKRKQEEERGAAKPRCSICGKEQSLLVRLNQREGDVGLYCDFHLAERERDDRRFKATQQVTKQPKEVGTPIFDSPGCDIAFVYSYLGAMGLFGSCVGLFLSIAGGSAPGIAISFSAIGMSIASFAVSSLLRDARTTAHFSKVTAQYLAKIAAKE